MEHLTGVLTVVIEIQFEGLCFLIGGKLIEGGESCSNKS
jgi:hypothetical protein